MEGDSMTDARFALAVLLLAAPAFAAPTPADPDTKAWWKLTAELSDDDYQGRDTGSLGHAKAAREVAKLFRKAGLEPFGDVKDGKPTYFQSVPIHEVAVEKPGTSIAIVAPGGAVTRLDFLRDITVRPTASLPRSLNAGLALRGYCSPAEIGSAVAGKLLVCLAGRRAGMPGNAEIISAAAAAGARGAILVDDAGFTLELPRWPAAYARSLATPVSKPPEVPTLAILRANPAALERLLQGSGQDAKALLADFIAGKPLPSADLPTRLLAEFALKESDYPSENIVARLPGTDPALAGEAVVVSAHIDGYGFGEPVDGDNLYNGAFDDAAYVATLIRLAQARNGKGFRRPLIFAAFTGEEKGLLGARWFVAHPPVPTTAIAANINLDAIRPLFPLKALTLIGHGTSSLTATATEVGRSLGIDVRPDFEPERGMAMRTDAGAFLAAGVPAVSFMFAYDKGSPEEARFRTWYNTRYHKPQDDITQPIDFQAAADFNRFFYTLTETVADAPARPQLTR
jgi:hypothetical protein